jgi:hypothetical protein
MPVDRPRTAFLRWPALVAIAGFDLGGVPHADLQLQVSASASDRFARRLLKHPKPTGSPGFAFGFHPNSKMEFAIAAASMRRASTNYSQV